MVLNELGSRIGAALAAMSNATVIDEAVLDTCLKAICTALLQVLQLSTPPQADVCKTAAATLVVCVID
jgi:SRP54-type protein, helical bundle domain